MLKDLILRSFSWYSVYMDSFTLWENDSFIVSTPNNPHQAYSEGLHVIVSPKQDVSSAWEDIGLAQATFGLAAQTCRAIEECKLAPWQNIQANGNWGLLPGGKTSFHIHILGRNKTQSWGKPIILPEAPGTYQNDQMPEADRNTLSSKLKASLNEQ
jgi:diadenosine tetraphosphate (Ap4A) HIT family hydrolase